MLVTNELGDLGWGQRTVEAEEVRGVTSNVRGGHGSSRDVLGLPVVPSGSHVQSGGPDVNGGTIVGEDGFGIIDGRGGNRDRLPDAGGRVPARVFVVVSSGHDNGNTAVVKLGIKSLVSCVAIAVHPLDPYRNNGPVNTGRCTAAQTHRSNRGDTGPPCVLGDPVHASDAVA